MLRQDQRSVLATKLNRPLIVMLDIDGTLRDYKDELRIDASDLARLANTPGAYIVFATGRGKAAALNSVRDIAQQAAKAGTPLPRTYVVANNGASCYIYDPATLLSGERIETVGHISTFAGGKVLQAAQENEELRTLLGEGFETLIELPSGELWITQGFPKQYLYGAQCEIRVNLDDILAELSHETDAVRVVFAGNTTNPADVQTKEGYTVACHIAAGLFKRLGLFVNVPVPMHDAWMEITPAGTDKFQAFRQNLLPKIMKTLLYTGFTNLDMLIIGAGDGANDAQMLTEVHVGCAMGQASDALKQIAEVVLPPVNENGAGVLLERLCNPIALAALTRSEDPGLSLRTLLDGYPLRVRLDRKPFHADRIQPTSCAVGRPAAGRSWQSPIAPSGLPGNPLVRPMPGRPAPLQRRRSTAPARG